MDACKYINKNMKTVNIRVRILIITFNLIISPLLLVEISITDTILLVCLIRLNMRIFKMEKINNKIKDIYFLYGKYLPRDSKSILSN